MGCLVRATLAGCLLFGLLVSGLSQPSQSSAAAPAFCDLGTGDPSYKAVSTLASLSIILGYANGCFGPNDTILRAQMAALIVRGMAWTNAPGTNPFPDQGNIDPQLWRAVGILWTNGVVQGYPNGTYNPAGNVLNAQTVSFITRAMVKKGVWQQQPDNPALYTNVPPDSPHRADIATYVHFAGALPDAPTTGGFNWSQPSTRAWFSRALWQALNWQARPGLDAEEAALLTIVNLFRNQNGLAGFALSPTLITTSTWMSTDLATRNPAEFSHTDSLGRNPFARMCAMNYCSGWRGENIAGGIADAAGVFLLWRDSPGHRENLLRPEFRAIGIARVAGPNSFHWYWTTDFGEQ